MKFNRDVIISEHVCERYLERFPHSLDRKQSREIQLRAAAEIIKHAFSEAGYISDRVPDARSGEKGGIIFANDEYGIKFIVRENVVVTVIPIAPPHGERADSSVGKNNDYHGPSQRDKVQKSNSRFCGN